MRAYLKLTVSGLLSFARDRAGLFWSFFFPVFFIVIFGTFFGGSGRDRDTPQFTIGLVIQDPSPGAAWVFDALRPIGIFKLRPGTLSTETAALKAGRRRLVVVFPPDFAERLRLQQPSTVRILYDGTQQQQAQIALGAMRHAIEMMDRGLTRSPSLLKPEDEPVMPAGSGRRRPQMMDFLLPGILAMTLMQLGLFAAIPIVNMREKGILKRFRATALPRSTLVASQVTQRVVIAIVQTLVLLGLGIGLYGFRVQGSLLALLGLVVLGVLTFVCMGALLSAFAKTQESAAPMVQLVNFPMMFLSGLFFPPEVLPKFLVPFSNALPSTHLADALRHVALAAPSQFSTMTNLGVMSAWLLVSLALAARFFRWE